MRDENYLATISSVGRSLPRKLKPQFRILILLFSSLTMGCSSLSFSSMRIGPSIAQDIPRCSVSADPFGTAIENALEASRLGQTATTYSDWSFVALKWLQAIEGMQSVPISSAKHPFAQKKVVEYLRYLDVAQQKAATLANDLPFASFDSDFLDEQLRLYLSYLAAVGKPDVLIVGSSRAIQGIDPQTLQAELNRQGKGSLRVFNFGINGATAQVVDLLLREVLTPQQLPKLIIWADGVRAFNSGRVDKTYNAIASSIGYQQLLAGDRPQLPNETLLPDGCEATEAPSLSKTLSNLTQSFLTRLTPFSGSMVYAAEIRDIDASGFLPETTRFNPSSYYRTHPRVAGRYDGDYQNFNLGGAQREAFDRVVAYTQQNDISLVVVSLPLTQDYLDSFRSRWEQQFRQTMTQKAQQQGFIFVDQSRQWVNQNDYFADPSHLNRYGAIAVSRQLATSSEIPWQPTPTNQ
ncbi:MAG: hypothetical protein ACOC0N_08335 [Chroococcales cyanobacterium]